MAQFEIETRGNENYGQALARELDEFLARGFRADMRTNKGRALRNARTQARHLRAIIDEHNGFRHLM